MPLAQIPRSRRDSWPPTQVRLDSSLPSPDTSLDNIDDDPLTYFLTPAPALEDMEDDIDMLDFDAGIEDASHRREIVRSVSPSSLNGLSKPRDASPDLSDGSTPDYDDDEEYIRFQPYTGFGLPFNLRDFTIDGIKLKPKSKADTHHNMTADALLSPSSFHIPPAAQGRTQARGTTTRGRPRTLSSRHRPSSHLWREPSPDVWSIEEETEEELNSELGSSVGAHSGIFLRDDSNQVDKKLESSAAKPKKKVRFVLPVQRE